MSEFLDIINISLIDPATDAFWPTPDSREALPTATDTLIISSNFAPGSAEEQQLHKILGACKLSTSDYSLVKLAAGEHRGWHCLKTLYLPKTVLLFGVHPQQLGISALFRLNGVNDFHGANWVPTLSLTELENQPQAKKDLWGNALKPLFADNQ